MSVGPGRRAAHAVEVRRERVVQRRSAAAAHVAELRRGHVGEHAPQRAQPRGSRELRAVGAARAEVDPRRPVGGGGRWRSAGSSGPIATRVYPPGPAGQVALGDELLVGLDDDAARDPELVGEPARGRQRGAARQPSRRGSRRGSTPRSGGAAQPRNRASSGPGRRPRGADWSSPASTGSDLIPSTNSWNARAHAQDHQLDLHHPRRRGRGAAPVAVARPSRRRARRADPDRPAAVLRRAADGPAHLRRLRAGLADALRRPATPTTSTPCRSTSSRRR